MAEIVLRKKKTDIDEGKHLDKEQKSTVKLGDFADRYLEWCKNAKSRRISQQEATAQGVGWPGRGRKDTLGCDITTANVENYRTERFVTVSRFGTKLSVATLNREPKHKGDVYLGGQIREMKIDKKPYRL